MHEIHLLEELFADILKYAQINKLKKVTKIYLRMGEFTEINQEILKFFFKEKAKKTIVQEAKLDIEWSPKHELKLLSLEGEIL